MTLINAQLNNEIADCNAEPYDGYCRKMLITGEIILINCTIKANFICVKGKNFLSTTFISINRL